MNISGTNSQPLESLSLQSACSSAECTTCVQHFGHATDRTGAHYSVIICANTALQNIAKYNTYSPMYLSTCVSATSTKFEKKIVRQYVAFLKGQGSWLFSLQ